ncbi:hypothetical protein [Erwinia sp. SLM-02]|uniref:hypothetical protein n=1 Tax=Erwinia sp. SLM-02 TaxID=3020057 RepID=UPI00307FE9F6
MRYRDYDIELTRDGEKISAFATSTVGSHNQPFHPMKPEDLIESITNCLHLNAEEENALREVIKGRFS